MSPDRKEEFRWQFAGQAMQAIIEATAHYINGNTQLPQKKFMGPTALMYADAIIEELEKTTPEQEHVREDAYPCTKCGKLRTKDEGGTVFSYCDECWDKDKQERCDHEPVIYRIDVNDTRFKCSKCDKHLYAERLR
jgi:hypothetical protein